MSRVSVIVVGVLSLVSCDHPAGSPPETLAALQSTLQGTWKGEGPCVGEFTFRADGTYERRHYSPGNLGSAGTWRLRWDELPPTLVLHCNTSDDSDEVGKASELKVLQLSRASFECQYPGGGSARYSRVQP